MDYTSSHSHRHWKNFLFWYSQKTFLIVVLVAIFGWKIVPWGSLYPTRLVMWTGSRVSGVCDFREYTLDHWDVGSFLGFGIPKSGITSWIMIPAILLTTLDPYQWQFNEAIESYTWLTRTTIGLWFSAFSMLLSPLIIRIRISFRSCGSMREWFI